MKARANKQNGATIKDVAERAGVSAMTVSRVLNEAARVRPETRERVKAAIADLNYTPNLSARSLAKARSFSIGLLYNNPSPGYVSELLVGLLNRCRQAGFQLVIENCGNTEAEWESRISGVLEASNFDGIVVAPPVGDFAAVRQAIEEAGTPYVRIAPEADIASTPYVSTDDFEASARMTRHLIDLGHRDIGFIKGAVEHGASKQREGGFRAAMADAGIAVNEDWVVQGRFTYRSALPAAETLLGRGKRPSAVFASNDEMAAGVIAIAHKFALDVPRDLSIVGFDDTHTATTVWPQLTTIRQPIPDMAAAAIDLLGEQFKAEDEDADREPVRIPSELIVRESAVPPRVD